MKNILVIGATGDVGQGIVSQLAAGGHRVLAVARNQERLAALNSRFPAVDTLAGSVEDETSAAALLGAVRLKMPDLDGVITSINLPLKTCTLSDISLDELIAVLRGNVGMHFVAAKTFAPALSAGGLYLGIGGGMVDLVFPGMGAVAMGQAAIRNMFRAMAPEIKKSGVRLQELIIYAMVAGQSNRAKADPKQITDEEVGRYVRAILERPEAFTDTILSLKSKAQVAELG